MGDLGEHPGAALLIGGTVLRAVRFGDNAIELADDERPGDQPELIAEAA
jgi:hypothetical protein